MPDPTSFPVLEQQSSSYYATVKDDAGVMIPASALVTMNLDLYVIKQDGNTEFINGRNNQNVLNLNNVTIFETLQTLADGRTYNLRWKIALADTTLVESLAFERHHFLFKWSTAQVAAGKHLGAFVVENLTTVT